MPDAQQLVPLATFTTVDPGKLQHCKLLALAQLPNSGTVHSAACANFGLGQRNHAASNECACIWRRTFWSPSSAAAAGQRRQQGDGLQQRVSLLRRATQPATTKSHPNDATLIVGAALESLDYLSDLHKASALGGALVVPIAHSRALDTLEESRDRLVGGLRRCCCTWRTELALALQLGRSWWGTAGRHLLATVAPATLQAVDGASQDDTL